MGRRRHLRGRVEQLPRPGTPPGTRHGPLFLPQNDSHDSYKYPLPAFLADGKALVSSDCG